MRWFFTDSRVAILLDRVAWLEEEVIRLQERNKAPVQDVEKRVAALETDRKRASDKHIELLDNYAIALRAQLSTCKKVEMLTEQVLVIRQANPGLETFVLPH